MQTSYDINQAAGQAGMKADSRKDDHVASYAAEEAIPFGRGVRLGTDPEAQVQLSDTGADCVGIALHTHAVEQTAAGVAQYDAEATVSVLRRGACYVEVLDAVTAGQQAFCEFTAADDKGKFRSSVNGGTAAAVPGTRFLTSTSGAGLAVVEINQP